MISELTQGRVFEPQGKHNLCAPAIPHHMGVMPMFVCLNHGRRPHRAQCFDIGFTHTIHSYVVTWLLDVGKVKSGDYQLEILGGEISPFHFPIV